MREDYLSRGTDYPKARNAMIKKLKDKLKKIGAKDIKEFPLGYGLDIGIKFMYKGEDYELHGIKHLYDIDEDEGIEDLWNWSFSFMSGEHEEYLAGRLGLDI